MEVRGETSAIEVPREIKGWVVRALQQSSQLSPLEDRVEGKAKAIYQY